MSMTSSFRRSVKPETMRKGGKGGKGSFHDRWYIPKGNQPEPFVMIAGDYTDTSPAPERVELDATGRPLPVKNAFFKAKMHKRKLVKNGKDWYTNEVCSAGPDQHNPQPCMGCTAMDMGDKSVTLSDLFVFTLLHLAPYHGHPYLDREGRWRMKEGNNEFVVVYDECDGRTCNFCRVLSGQPPILQQGQTWPNYPPNSITTTFGRRRYIEVGKNHLGHIAGWDQAISSACAYCQQQLTTDAFNCSVCKTPCIDMANDPRSDEQIADAVSKPYPCSRCQRNQPLEEVVSCDFCASQGRQGLQINLWDAVIWGMKQGENTASQLMMSRYQPIDSYQQQLPPNIQQLLNGKTIRQLLEEIGKPFDFDKIFEPKSLADQAKRLELQIPIPGQGGYGQQGGYGSQPMQGYQPQQQPYMAYGGQQQPPQQQYANPPAGYQQPMQPGYAPQQQGYPAQQPAQAPGQQGFYQPSYQQPQQAPAAPGPVPFMPAPRPNYGQ